MKIRNKRRRVVIYIKQRKRIDSSVSKTTKSSLPRACKTEPYIKKEDIQQDLHHSSNSVASNTRSSALSKSEPDNTLIKHETTEKYNPLSSSGKFDGRDYYYCCRLCDKEMPSLRAVLDHRRIVHAVERTITVIKDIDVEPDVSNPNNYCKSCDKSYTFSRYRHHLKRTHHMVLKPLSRDRKKNDIVPDPHNPDAYCASCDRKLSSNHNLIRHCQRIHGMKDAKYKTSRWILPQPKETLPDLNDPSFYCRICDITSKSKELFRSHGYHVHKMRPISPESSRLRTGHPITSTHPKYYCYICNTSFCEKRQLHKHLFVIHSFDDVSLNQPSDRTPDIDDPNLYCCVCNRSYTDKSHFRNHVQAVHSVGATAQDKKKQQPDPDDPDNYCRVCDRKYDTKLKYRSHLRYSHFMVLRPPTAYRPNQFPDPHDPNLYCFVCKSYSKNRVVYRRHCIDVHHMKLSSVMQTNVNPDAEIDINDPKNYCSRCDKTMKSKVTFVIHLRQIHNIRPEPTRKTEAKIDINDPNNYCAQCEKYFVGYDFTRHLERSHNLRKVPTREDWLRRGKK